MRKLLLVVLLAGLYVPADFFAKGYAEGKIEERVETAAAGEQNPDADIDSFPFLGRVLVTGDLGDISIRASAVPAGPLEFDVLELQLDGVRVDRDLLFQRKVKLREIDAGTLRLTVASQLDIDGISIPRTPLIPCAGDARSEAGNIIVSCRFEQVPQAFVDVSNRVTE